MESKAPSIHSEKKTVLYQDKDILVSCEELHGILFLHCHVEEYGKGVRKRLKGVWEELEKAFLYHGHTEVFAYAPPQPSKFAQLFGNPEVIDKIHHLGDTYEVIRWDLL